MIVFMYLCHSQTLQTVPHYEGSCKKMLFVEYTKLRRKEY
jgi:hypothetical protein